MVTYMQQASSVNITVLCMLSGTVQHAMQLVVTMFHDHPSLVPAADSAHRHNIIPIARFYL